MAEPRAVCLRCGGSRDEYLQICPACGYRPAGEGLLVSWLLSSENLDGEALDGAAARVRDGETIRPSDKMLVRARRALGSTFSDDPGLDARQLLGLFLTNVLFTPLVGWVCWGWWRNERPRAALQALLVSVPVSAVFTMLMLVLLFMPR